MERAERIAFLPCDPGWSIWARGRRCGNNCRGMTRATVRVRLSGRQRGCLVRRGRHRLRRPAIAVIQTPDAVLVSGRRATDAGRRLVRNRPGQASAHARGSAWGLPRAARGPGLQVKEIVVAPGGRLSLQSHEHRAEHWVVVAGAARVTVGDEVMTLAPNQSVHVPLGARHRMENPGTVPMRLIEVQCGDYLGEDDIIRYEDVYGRT
jgi:mannose-6-phosphate isomerase-like protein (cupin superfamily)